MWAYGLSCCLNPICKTQPSDREEWDILLRMGIELGSVGLVATGALLGSGPGCVLGCWMMHGVSWARWAGCRTAAGQGI